MRTIDVLKWDSDFFGYPVGRIDISGNTELPCVFIEEAHSFKLVYFFADRELNVPGLDLVDKKVTLQHNIQLHPSFEAKSKDIRAFDLSRDSYEDLVQLALQSGTYSRFFIDKNFVNAEYERLYKEWIRTLVYGDDSTIVLVHAEHNRLQGFIGMKIKDGKAEIVLIAVSTAYRGRGIGKKLINQALGELKEKGVIEVRVVTQDRNIPALKLYQGSGFNISNITYIYHYWKK